MPRSGRRAALPGPAPALAGTRPEPEQQPDRRTELARWHSVTEGTLPQSPGLGGTLSRPILGFPGRRESSPPSRTAARLSRLLFRSSVLIQADIPSFMAAFPN